VPDVRRVSISVPKLPNPHVDIRQLQKATQVRLSEMHRIDEVPDLTSKREVGSPCSVIGQRSRIPSRMLVTLPIADEHADRFLSSNPIVRPFAEKHERDFVGVLVIVQALAIDPDIDQVNILSRERISTNLASSFTRSSKSSQLLKFFFRW